jgi:hypothetical protein
MGFDLCSELELGTWVTWVLTCAQRMNSILALSKLFVYILRYPTSNYCIIILSNHHTSENVEHISTPRFKAIFLPLCPHIISFPDLCAPRSP